MILAAAVVLLVGILLAIGTVAGESDSQPTDTPSLPAHVEDHP